MSTAFRIVAAILDNLVVALEDWAHELETHGL